MLSLLPDICLDDTRVIGGTGLHTLDTLERSADIYIYIYIFIRIHRERERHLYVGVRIVYHVYFLEDCKEYGRLESPLCKLN